MLLVDSASAWENDDDDASDRVSSSDMDTAGLLSSFVDVQERFCCASRCSDIALNSFGIPSADLSRSPNLRIRSPKVSVAFCSFFSVGAASGYVQVIPRFRQRVHVGFLRSHACLPWQRVRITVKVSHSSKVYSPESSATKTCCSQVAVFTTVASVASIGVAGFVGLFTG